ncbi:Cadherin-like and PC-esterase domain-containing protein 1 [Taenia crassiceps]|uniref:Cadherin-like and PC-esterase domain-containing protein 1 n=1 Tax=Taenia crassiceps TaxID=6207 RepID=A0ABR4Q6P9_9CEST
MDQLEETDDIFDMIFDPSFSCPQILCNCKRGTRLRPHSVVLLQTNHSRVSAASNCGVHVNISRHLRRNPVEDSTRLTCAYFQSCSFIFNERFPCGIHDFANSPRWLEASQQLHDANEPTFGSLGDLYKDRVYPLWLLPCAGACSSKSRCFWHQAKLLRFTLDSNWDTEYLEASGIADYNSGLSVFGRVFTSELPESAWTQMRGYLNNSAILFVGDSTLRGLMYALLNKLNGSLRYWEASHDQLVFESLDGGFFQRTNAKSTGGYASSVIAFAYFPLFWSRKRHGRNLADVISQSLRRIAKENVDLVIGGTQWLSAGHMKKLNNYLSRNEGQRVRRIVVKSHQAGFHVPNYLTHHFSLEEHLQKRRKVNEEIWRLGGELKWARIDAYHLTWSNLFHFAADSQCSCHFHKAVLDINSGEYVISGEVTEALLQNLVYHLLSDNKI